MRMRVSNIFRIALPAAISLLVISCGSRSGSTALLPLDSRHTSAILQPFAYEFTFTPIPMPSGGATSVALGVNAAGDVAGNVGDGANSEAIRVRNGVEQILTPGLKGTAQAQAIDKYGDAVGLSYPTGARQSAYLWNADGTSVNIDKGKPWVSSGAMAINNNHIVVGKANISTSGLSFGWKYANGNVTKLSIPTAFAGYNITAAAINDSGTIAGYAVSTASSSFIRWVKGVPSTFGPSGAHATVEAINSTGHITGGYGITAVYHAFIYDGSTFHNIANPSGDYDCSGMGINSRQYVVIDCYHHSYLYHAGHWLTLDTLVPSSAGVTISGVTGINDNCTIVGIDSTWQGYVLKPVSGTCPTL